MGDFDDGREMGLWGADGIPYWDGDNEDENIEKGYIVALTPKRFLKQYQKNKRSHLNINSSLKLVHNRFNEHDRYALEVYFDSVFIGHVRKNYDDGDKSLEINKWCFEDGFLTHVYIVYLAHGDFSIRKYENASDKSWRNTTYREQVDNILFRKNSVPMQETEGITIKYALKNKKLYNFTDDDIATLKMRLATIATEQIGGAGRAIGTTTIDATEKILTESLDIAGKTMKFFGWK